MNNDYIIPTEEDEYLILPNNHWYELLYIYYVLKDIIVTNTDKKQKWLRLKRQIKIWSYWIKVK